MFNKEFNIRARRAGGVTLELILAITLAVLVLFFILGLFGDNLKGMVASSRITNMFDNTQKASYAKEAFDPTQVNVQVLAEQGLTLPQYLDNANAIIKKYETTPPPNQEELQKLAQAATVAKIITKTISGGYQTQTLSYTDEGIFSQRDGIDIYLYNSSSYNTTISIDGKVVKTLNFPIATTSNVKTLNSPLNSTDQLTAVKAVLSGTFQ